MLFFVVLAPPIGAVAFTFILGLASLPTEPWVEILGLVPATFGFALFSYIFGALPALVTGAVAGTFRPSLNTRVAYVAMGLFACLLSLVFGFAMTYHPTSDWTEVQNLFLLFGGPALFSGTVTSFLFRSKPNNPLSTDALTRAVSFNNLSGKT